MIIQSRGPEVADLARVGPLGRGTPGRECAVGLARIAEHPQPGGVLAPLGRVPAVLHGAEYPLGVRHQDGCAPIGGGEPGDAERRAVGIGGVVLGRRTAVIDVTQAHEACGERLVRRMTFVELGAPFAVGHSDGEATTSTREVRASNCSERLRTKRGQWSAPGISSLRCENIWQPLQTPRLKLSPRWKKAANSSRARGLNRIDLAQPPPAPSTSP